MQCRRLFGPFLFVFSERKKIAYDVLAPCALAHDEKWTSLVLPSPLLVQKNRNPDFQKTAETDTLAQPTIAVFVD